MRGGGPNNNRKQDKTKNQHKQTKNPKHQQSQEMKARMQKSPKVQTFALSYEK